MGKIQAKKHLGQNFLIDDAIANAIVKEAAVRGCDVLEIGPGTGILTFKLADIVNKLVAVEIDRRLYERLKERLKDRENVYLINEDILKVNLLEYFNDIFTVVANLPYYITTPIIMKLIEIRSKIDKIVVMVQKEVGERIVAVPGNKHYGVLSLAVQYYAVPEIILNVPREAFKPQPQVDSVVVRMNMRKSPAVCVEEKVFFKIVKAAFASRRKTLLNALYGGNILKDKADLKNAIEGCGIDPEIRGEDLSMEDFARLTQKLGPLCSKN